MAQSVFEFTSSGGKKAAATISEVNKNLTRMLDITKSFKKTPPLNVVDPKAEEDIKKYQGRLDVVTAHIDDMRAAMDKVKNGREFVSMTEDLEKAEKVAEQLKEHINDIKAPDLGNMGGGGGGGEGGNLREGFDTGADVTELAQMFSGSGGLGDALQSVSGNFNQLKTTLGGLEGTAGIAGAALAGVALGFKVFDAITGHTEEAMTTAINATKKKFEMERQVADVVAQGTQAVQDRLTAIAAERDSMIQERNEQIQNAQQYTGMFDQIRTVLESGLKGIARSFLDFIHGIPGLEGALQGLTTWATSAPTIYGQAGEAIQEANQQIDSLNQETQMLTDSMQKAAAVDLKQIFKDYADSVASYNAEVTSMNRQAQQEDARQQQDWNTEDLRRDEDHNRDLAKQRAEFNKRIADLYKQDAKAQQEAAKNLAKSLEELAKDQKKQADEAAKQFQKDTKDAQESYYKDLAKAEAQYAKDRRRRVEDLNDDLRNAERANDVLAFIAAQEAADKDLKRMDEDHRDELGESKKQFEEQEAQRQQQYADQLADLQKSGDERRQELLTAYAEEQADRAAALKEQIAEEQASYAQSLAEAEEARQIERQRQLEDRALQQQRTAEDRQRQLDELRQQHQKEIDALKQKENQVKAAMQTAAQQQVAVVQTGMAQVTNTFRTAMSNMQAAATNFSRQGSTRPSVNNPNVSSSGGFGAPRGNTGSAQHSAITHGSAIAHQTIRGFASGGVVDKPTVSLLGENLRPGEVEVVKPMPRNMLPSGAGAGMGGRQTVYNQNAPITIGGNAEGVITEKWVKTQIEGALDAIVGGVADATG